MDQNALILGKSLYPCGSGGCASLIKRLQKQFSFRHIEECEAAPDGLPFAPDIVVLRLAAPAAPENLLSACRDHWPQAQRFGVVCAGLGGAAGEYSLLLNGVDDFVTCPYQEPELFFRLDRVLRAKRATGKSCGSFTWPLDKFPLVGASAAFRGVLEKIPLVADSILTVLVSGETGSGKELLANPEVRAAYLEGGHT
jgi:DNA-binding NtrC family response regulator